MTQKQKDEIFLNLRNYNGENCYIKSLKNDVYITHKKKDLNDFEYEYIHLNNNFIPRQINKVVSISDWLGEKKQTEFGTEFVPKKIKIIALLGETPTIYHCIVRYRQSEDPVSTFLPKRGVLENFLADDYTKLNLDFNWFDKKLKEINENFKVMPHQRESVKFLLTRKKCILSLDQGLGKTMSAIVASLMYGNKKVLVICPASLKTNWKSEISRFIDEENISIIKSPSEMKRDELISFLNLPTDTKMKVGEMRDAAKENGKWNEGKQFTIVNFDIIDEFHKDTRKTKNDDSLLLKSNFDIVIIDEAHKLSQNSSSRYKVIRNYLKKAKNDYTWLLTGTMLTNNIRNLYNMLCLIESDITGEYDFFMNRYCGAKKILMKGEWDKCWAKWNKWNYSSYSELSRPLKETFKEYVDRFGKHATITNDATNLEELNSRIKHLYFRLMKDDVMKDVEKKIIPIEYTLSESELNEYNELWDKYEKEKENEGKDVSEIKNLISVTINRQYISKLMLPKTIELTEKLLSKGVKVFVVCCYDEEVYSLKEYFGDKSVIFNGKMNQAQKDNSVDLFNNDDNVKVFIGQIIACGVGINLNKSCNHAVFQNLDFTDSSFAQACDRIFRLGSEKDAYIYLQYFKDTVYEHIIDIVSNKRNIASQVINNKN